MGGAGTRAAVDPADGAVPVVWDDRVHHQPGPARLARFGPGRPRLPADRGARGPGDHLRRRPEHRPLDAAGRIFGPAPPRARGIAGNRGLRRG